MSEMIFYCAVQVVKRSILLINVISGRRDNFIEQRYKRLGSRIILLIVLNGQGNYFIESCYE